MLSAQWAVLIDFFTFPLFHILWCGLVSRFGNFFLSISPYTRTFGGLVVHLRFLYELMLRQMKAIVDANSSHTKYWDEFCLYFTSLIINQPFYKRVGILFSKMVENPWPFLLRSSTRCQVSLYEGLCCEEVASFPSEWMNALEKECIIIKFWFSP